MRGQRSKKNRTARKVARIVVGALVGAAGLLGQACSSDGPLYVTPIQRAEAFKFDRDAYTRLGYRQEWTGFPTLTRGAHVTSMDILGDVVVVQESSNLLSVLEAGNGATRWFEQVANPLTRFVGNTRDGSRILSCSESEAFFFDVDTGTLVDKHSLDKLVNTRPVLVGDTMVFGTAAGEIYAQNKTVGFRVWGNSISGNIRTNPAVLGSLLAFVSDAGEVIMIDGSTGAGQMRTQIYTGCDVEPVASDSLVFIASLDHSLYAFSPSQPQPVWRQRTDAPLRQKPTYHDGRVYCSLEGTGLVAFDARGENGHPRKLWTAAGVGGTVIGVRGGRLLAWDGENAVLLNPDDGSVVESVKLDNVAQLKSDTFVDGNLYAVSNDGVVLKMLPRN